MALHRLKIIAGQELKSIVTTLCTQGTKKKEKNLCMGVVRDQILPSSNIQNPRTPTRVARISELNENNLRAEGMGMGSGLVK